MIFKKKKKIKSKINKKKKDSIIKTKSYLLYKIKYIEYKEFI